MRTPSIRLAFSGALAALLLAPTLAPAQPRERHEPQPTPTIRQLQVAVTRPGGHERPRYLDPGDELELRIGESVRLQLVGTPVGGSAASVAVPARLAELAGKQTIEVSEVDERDGSALLTAVRTRETGPHEPSALVSWEISGAVERTHGVPKTGTISIEVLDRAGRRVGPGDDGDHDRGDHGRDDHDRGDHGRDDHDSGGPADLIAMLYQGILLRAPDPDGAAPRVRAIEEQGYPGLLAQARQIAESTESRVGVYDKGITNPQRLAALYRELLGREAGEVDHDVWSGQLRQLERGEIAGVVESILRTSEFTRSHPGHYYQRHDSHDDRDRH